MLIPKKTRNTILQQLFKDGVLVARKDYNAPKHNELDTVPNLMVIKAMQSLKSRGYVTEMFAWRHYYWSLTNEGIEYLREYLHLPQEVVPNTLKRQTRPEVPRTSARPAAAGGREGRGFGGDRGDRGDRDAYRRSGPGGPEKKVGASSDFNPDFRGGYGRGRGFGGDSTSAPGAGRGSRA